MRSRTALTTEGACNCRNHYGARLALALAITLALLAAQAAPAFAAFSGDVAGSGYEPAVKALYQVGIIGNEWAISLQPQQLLTRAEEARLLSRALTGETNARSFLQLRFPDVAAGHWAKPYIDTAVILGLMPGRADAAFNPNGKVARGQFATDVLKLCGYRPTSLAEAMGLALDLGLVDGNAPSSYAYITRGDAVTMAYRAFFGVINPELGSTLARRAHGSRLRPVPPGETSPSLEVHFLTSVGATLVRLPSGADWLIDTGTPATLPALFSHLASLGVDRIDALVISDAIHSPVGAVAAVTDRLTPATTVKLSDLAATANGQFPAALLANDKDVKVDLIARGAAATGYQTALRLSRGTLRILLAGGLNAAGERLLAGQDKARLQADIWLPARLGTFEQHDLSFVTAVGPRFVVAADAAEPDAAAYYEGLAAAGAEIVPADADGTVVIAINSRDVTVAKPQPMD